jgi:hypothetical protein
MRMSKACVNRDECFMRLGIASDDKRLASLLYGRWQQTTDTGR